MREPDRPVLTTAGLKHPRVREFLAAKRHPASRGLPDAVTLEGTWMIGHALKAGIRLQAVFVCPAVPRAAEGLALASTAVGLGAEGYEATGTVRTASPPWARPAGERSAISPSAAARGW
jgi:hypothetical protein